MAKKKKKLISLKEFAGILAESMLKYRLDGVRCKVTFSDDGDVQGVGNRFSVKYGYNEHIHSYSGNNNDEKINLSVGLDNAVDGLEKLLPSPHWIMPEKAEFQRKNAQQTVIVVNGYFKPYPSKAPEGYVPASHEVIAESMDLYRKEADERAFRGN